MVHMAPSIRGSDDYWLSLCERRSYGHCIPLPGRHLQEEDAKRTLLLRSCVGTSVRSLRQLLQPAGAAD